MNKQLLILLCCMFVVMTGYGVTLAVLPFYIERMALAESVTMQGVSLHVGMITGVFALMQFFFAPFWGKLSDRIGRRKVLQMSMLGFAVANFSFGLSTNLLMLYLSRVLGGILSAAVLPVSTAFVADITLESQRGKGMAWLGSASGLGAVIGPALGSWLAKTGLPPVFTFDYLNFDAFSVPFFAAGILSIIAWGGIIICLKEPETPDTDRMSVSLKTLFSTMIMERPFRILLYLSFLIQFAMSLFEGTFALHGKEVIGFGPTEMGLVFMVCGLIMALAQGGAISWLIDETREKALLFSGYILMGSSLLLLMIPRNLIFVLIFTAMFGLGMAMIIPTLVVMIIRQASSNTGGVLGVQNAANSLGQSMGPLAGGLLFALSIHLPYLLAGILLLGSSALILKQISANGREIQNL